jgi:hypothetical protein
MVEVMVAVHMVYEAAVSVGFSEAHAFELSRAYFVDMVRMGLEANRTKGQ